MKGGQKARHGARLGQHLGVGKHRITARIDADASPCEAALLAMDAWRNSPP